MKYLSVILVMLLLTGAYFAQEDAMERFSTAFCELYNLLKGILPLGVLVVIILAGLVFALGQVLGAETRARANVWATNMIIGTVIAVIVIILVPWLLDNLLPELNLLNSCQGV